MPDSKPLHLDRGIAIVSNLAISFTRMLEAYGEIGTVLAKEVEAIEAHDLTAVEQSGGLKVAAAQKVEAEYAKCEEEARNLLQLYLQVTGEETMPPVAGVEGCVHLASQLDSAFSVAGERSLRLNIFRTAQQNLRNTVQRFTKLMSELKPKLERNRAIIATLLRNHQESNAFWRQMALEDAASYDAFGTKKATGSGSQLAVTV